MRVAIGILTHNPLSSLRFALLEQTINSLRAAFDESERVIRILDNGSTDGSADVLADLGAIRYEPGDGNSSPGRGRNVLMGELLKGDPELVVLSDDDVTWKPEAGAFLRSFWSCAPDDVAILSGLLEPEWDWNTPRGIVDAGDVRALWRDSAPAAAWTFRARAWSDIGPLREIIDGLGEDYHACLRLRGANLRVAQADLAEHAGCGYSLLGNDGHYRDKPLDRQKWGI